MDMSELRYERGRAGQRVTDQYKWCLVTSLTLYIGPNHYAH